MIYYSNFFDQMPASERRFSGRLFCLVFWSRQWMQAWMVSLIHFVRQILVAIFCPTTNPTSAYSQERWPISLLLQARTPLFFMPKKAAVLRSCKSALVCSVCCCFQSHSCHSSSKMVLISFSPKHPDASTQGLLFQYCG